MTEVTEVKPMTAGPLAQSLAQMIIEWVDGANGQDWHLGLPAIIQKRIDRFEGANTSSHEAMKAFVQAYDTWRAAEDAVGCNEDIVEEDELRTLCAAEAKALVALIEARAALKEKRS